MDKRLGFRLEIEIGGLEIRIRISILTCSVSISGLSIINHNSQFPYLVRYELNTSCPIICYVYESLNDLQQVQKSA